MEEKFNLVCPMRGGEAALDLPPPQANQGGGGPAACPLGAE